MDLETGSTQNVGTPADVANTPAGTNVTQGVDATANLNAKENIPVLQKEYEKPIGDINKDAWFNQLSNPDLKGYAELRNWKNVDSVVESYQNLEKLMGADKAGRGIVMPTEDDAEGWEKFYDKLGRPQTPDEYKLEILEGYDGKMTSEAAKWMYEAGLTAKQATDINNKYNEYLAQTAQAAEAQYQQKSEQEAKAVMDSWGKDADKNVELFRRGARAANVNEDILGNIERAIGVTATYELFKNIGASYLEDTIVSSNTQNPFGLSPEAARVKLETLKKDKVWANSYLNGDATARQEWDALHKVAYGG